MDWSWLPGLASGLFSSSSQSHANNQNVAMSREMAQFNAKEAQKNRDWQTSMSNTAHQREVSDLRAAGLNPILSVNAGASTPSGSSASGQAAHVESTDSGSAISRGFSTAMQSKQLDLARRQQDNADALNASQVKSNTAAANKANEEAETVRLSRTEGEVQARIANIRANTSNLGEIQNKVKAEAAQVYAEMEQIEHRIILLQEQARTERSAQARNYASAELAEMQEYHEGLKSKVTEWDAALADLGVRGLKYKPSMPRSNHPKAPRVRDPLAPDIGRDWKGMPQYR